MENREGRLRRAGEKSTFACANDDFALRLYSRLRKPHSNLFFSPFSVRSVLAMAFAGARGETAAQMREGLRVPSSDEELHAGFGEIIERLNRGGGGEYEMTVANSLWGQDGAELQSEFVDRMARHWGGGMNLVDFRRDAEAARAAVNRWVEERTRQKILDLIPPGGLDGATRLVLANAVYVKGTWVYRFPEEQTSKQRFYLEGGDVLEVPLMKQKGDVRYFEGRDFQAVDLDYRGDDLSMLIVLPHAKDGLSNLEAKLSTRMLEDCATQARVRAVELYIPRFTMTWGTVDLREALDALGMPLAFARGEADFSGMNGFEPPHDESLFISAAFHKAFVEVNEEGTEAAAATAISMIFSLGGSSPVQKYIPVFRADHPFLFAIRDRKSGAILFLGRMADPTRDV